MKKILFDSKEKKLQFGLQLKNKNLTTYKQTKKNNRSLVEI
jgi:hypothetical protein